jgi:hypothetical protein
LNSKKPESQSQGPRRSSVAAIDMILSYDLYTRGFQRANESLPPKFICSCCGTGFAKRQYAKLHQKVWSSNCQVQDEIKLARVLWATCVLADSTRQWHSECPVCLEEAEVVLVCSNTHRVCRKCLKHPRMVACPLCRATLTARE